MSDKEQPTDSKLVSSYQNITTNSNELPQIISDIVEEKVNKELAHDKATLFTVFGIFASIVTLTSIEIQILKNTCSFWKITGLSLTMLSSLLFFIFVLDYIGRAWREEFLKQLKTFPWHLLTIVSVIFFIGISLSAFGNEQSCIENYIYSRYEKSSIEKQILFENQLQSDIAALKKIIGKNYHDIKKLQQYISSIDEKRLKMTKHSNSANNS